MGRAYYSSTRSTPTVKAEPAAPMNPVYEKWSVSNPFDPDSDEFWDDAQCEKFVDIADIDVDRGAAEQSMPELLPEDPESSSSSSESGGPERASPMAEGSDDPAALLVVPSRYVWERIESEPWNYVSSDWIGGDRTDVLRFRTDTDTTMPELIPSSPTSPVTPRYVVPALSAPSSAPAVSPRTYHWARRSVPPTSGNNVGPLTNATARRSLARISPVRARVQAFSV